MTNQHINCFKYNYALETEVQNFSSFQAKIKLSKDGKELLIINRKPVEKIQAVNEDEQQIVKDKQRPENVEEDPDYQSSELEEGAGQVEFQETMSSASCKLSEINNIIYGG